MVTEQQNDLVRLGDAVGPALRPVGHQALLTGIVERIRELFSAAACSVALLSDDETELVFEATSGAGADAVIGQRIGVNRGIAGWVAGSGQAIVVADVSQDPRFDRELAESTGYVPRSIVALPLETERMVVGVLEVLDAGSVTGDTARDLHLLGILAAQAALALEGSLVFGRLGAELLAATGLAERPDRTRRPPGDPELAAIAGAFQRLASAGPAQRRLAVRVLEAVCDFGATSP